MGHFVTEQFVAAPVDRVFRFFATPLNLARISPPAMGARLVGAKLVPPPGADPHENLAGLGSEVTISVRLLPYFPVRAVWMARIVEFEWNRHFLDVQVRGPFEKFEHRHQFEAAERDGGAGTVIRDVISYELLFGRMGRLGGERIAERELKRMFRERHRRTAEALSIAV